MNIEKEREAFKAWAATFNHDSNEWEDMPRDEVFIAGMKAARVPLLEEIEGLRAENDELRALISDAAQSLCEQGVE